MDRADGDAGMDAGIGPDPGERAPRRAGAPWRRSLARALRVRVRFYVGLNRVPVTLQEIE